MGYVNAIRFAWAHCFDAIGYRTMTLVTLRFIPLATGELH